MRQQRESSELTLARRDIAPASPDVADVVAQVVRLGFGLVSLGLAVALRSLGETPPIPRGSRPRLPVSDLADVVVGTGWWAARLSGRLANSGSRVAAPVVSFVLRPPGVPSNLQLAHGADLIVDRWRRDRPETIRSLGDWSSGAFTSSVDGALRHVDLERLLTAVLDTMDLDRVVADVVRRLDMDALVDLVLARMDVDKAASTALDQLDLTEIVMQDVDLVAVAEYVVAAIDLPEIIRASTGSVASEAVRGLRMQGVDADLAVARLVDRVLFRHNHRRESSVPTAEEPAAAAGSREQT